MNTKCTIEEHRENWNDTWAEYDAQGVYLARVCHKCVNSVLAHYRPEILTGYTQSDVDEPIEAEDWI